MQLPKVLPGITATQRPLVADGRYKILPAGVVSEISMFTQEAFTGNVKL